MASLRPGDVNQLVKSPNPLLKAILIHGNDVGRVREIAADLVRVHAGSLDDPFNVVRLEDPALKEDPARLADEAQAISLMGGKRAIWVRSAGSAFTAAIKTYLEHATGDALIVAESGALRKGQALRELFEKATNAGALACYEDTSRDIASIITEDVKKYGLSISNEARSYLSQILGADRALSRSELEKLTLYCKNKNRIELEDVEAVCGDASALTLDDTIDAIFEGDIAKADRRINRLIAGGTQTQNLVTAVTQHTLKLQLFALEVQSGPSAKQVVDAARPPVFWKRKDSMIRQLNGWEPESLDGALGQLREAELTMRNLPALTDAIASRTLLSLASRARRARRQAY